MLRSAPRRHCSARLPWWAGRAYRRGADCGSAAASPRLPPAGLSPHPLLTAAVALTFRPACCARTRCWTGRWRWLRWPWCIHLEAQPLPAPMLACWCWPRRWFSSAPGGRLRAAVPGAGCRRGGRSAAALEPRGLPADPVWAPSLALAAPVAAPCAARGGVSDAHRRGGARAVRTETGWALSDNSWLSEASVQRRRGGGSTLQAAEARTAVATSCAARRQAVTTAEQVGTVESCFPRRARHAIT